jgi:hypothetical protein
MTKDTLKRIFWLALGSVVLILEACAIYSGHMRVGKYHTHDVSIATNPARFWESVALGTLWALLCFYMGLRR